MGWCLPTLRLVVWFVSCYLGSVALQWQSHHELEVPTHCLSVHHIYHFQRTPYCSSGTRCDNNLVEEGNGTKTTLEDLHNWWAFPGNIKEILLAGRKINLIAIAALLVAVSPVNGPLFQRASTIRPHNVVLSGGTVHLPVVRTFTVGSGYLTGRNRAPGFLTPQFAPVAQVSQFNAKRSS